MGRPGFCGFSTFAGFVVLAFALVGFVKGLGMHEAEETRRGAGSARRGGRVDVASRAAGATPVPARVAVLVRAGAREIAAAWTADDDTDAVESALAANPVARSACSFRLLARRVSMRASRSVGLAALRVRIMARPRSN